MKTCPVCNKIFNPSRKDNVYCCKKCVYKQYNDNRPRKTMKRYGLAETARDIHIPQDQIEVIIGSLMGDACLILQTNKFHRMSLCHCEKQLEYLILKKNILKHIFLQEKVNRCDNKGNIQYSSGSISHKDLTNIYGVLYRKNKFISRRFLNLVTPTSLLFWFGDDGSIIKASGNTIIFCTDSFSLSENKSIKKWLWQEYDIEAKIMETKGSYNKNKTYYRLRLTKEPTKRFFNIVFNSPFFLDVVNVLPWKFPSEYYN